MSLKRFDDVFCFGNKHVIEFASIHILTLPKTNSSPLKIGRAPKGKSSSNHQFSSAKMLVSREGKQEAGSIFFLSKNHRRKTLGKNDSYHLVMIFSQGSSALTTNRRPDTNQPPMRLVGRFLAYSFLTLGPNRNGTSSLISKGIEVNKT